MTNPSLAGEAPKDRVLLACSYEPGLKGHWPACWRMSVPGYGIKEDLYGDAYTKFVRFWGAVSHALRCWDRNGRRPPVMSHLSSEDRAWMEGV